MSVAVSAILKTKGTNVYSVDTGATLADVVGILSERRIGAVLVMADDAVAGVLSERDVVRALARDGSDCLGQPVSSYMTTAVVYGSPSDSVEALMETMTNGRFRHVPIIDSGKLMGIISIGDVVKRRIDDAVHEAEALREYVSGAG
jgi:CBS domain-containing protein